MLIYDACKVGHRAVLIYWAGCGSHLDIQFSMKFLKNVEQYSLDRYGRVLASVFYAGMRIPEDR